MWNYYHKKDFETSVKISPFCHTWQSVCWVTLKTHEWAKYILLDRSVAYQVAFSMVIMAITGLVSIWFWKRRQIVPISEIHRLRERVQFCNHDMAVLQDTLDTALEKRSSTALEVADDKLTEALQEPEEETPKPDPIPPEIEATSDSETQEEPSHSKATETEKEPGKSSIPIRVDNKRKAPIRSNIKPTRDLKDTTMARIPGQTLNLNRNRVRLVKSAPSYKS
ncbi:uncharacterized protein saturn [Drosophila bipectinata]|uniref:uncharacterized protein saturn n=1 Tax=Drosophila bipectinata TaxID=42026 RepID=UPI001C8A4E57|nr:uncharacterized protein LOC108120739 [Drosophila bipectinata]